MKVGNWRLALGVAVAGMYMGGCAQNVPDIDRTQPNKVEKQLFQNDDEWYYRQTIVDTDQVASAGGGYAFEAFEGGLYRVRWTITEDVLYAMSTVEPAEGSYDGKLEEEGRRIGVVAAFPIMGHFDVQRQYSAATGEQSNVITENGSDRHWYDRKYMRVDWSRNMAGTLSQVGGWAGQFSATSREIPQEDGVVDPNRTRLSDDYIDTVTEYYYEPDLYACFTTYGFDSIFNCEGGPLRVRNSFVKVPEEETFIPLEYTDNQYLEEEDGSRLLTQRIYDPSLGKIFPVQCDEYSANFERDEFGRSVDDICSPATFDLFSRFGYFRTERVSFDERRGTNQESQRLYYANRWNIWQTMLNEDGSVMDMADRTPKPIVYYTNPEYPRDMWPGAQEVADQWNDAFLDTVRIAQHKTLEEVKADLEETYGEGNDYMYAVKWNNCSAPMLAKWATDHGSAQGEDLMDVPTILADFKSKWSTGADGDSLLPEGGDAELYTAVWASAHDARTQLCAELEYATETRGEGGFTWQRIGDLRYSFFNWIDQEVPWLGYGPSAADPITGQIISGNANFAGASIRRYGPYAADIVMYMNGDLEEEDLIRGESIRQYLESTQREAREAGQELSPAGKREMASRAGIPSQEVSPTNFEERPTIDQIPHDIRVKGIDAVQAAADRNSLANVQAKASDTRMAEFFDKPQVRQLYMQDPNYRVMVESMAATQYGPDWDQDDLNQAFIDVSAPALLHARRTERNKKFMSKNIMLAENMEHAMQSLVTYAGVNKAFEDASREEIEKHFLHNMFVGTQLHEVGHTVGLRHNFSASMDVLNYHDEYWEVQRAVAEGKINSDERWSVQGELAKEIAGYDIEYLNEAEFRLASVMDYTGDLTGRFGGLGKYDKAAINFAYGEVVEQFLPDSELQEQFGVSGINNLYPNDMWLSDYTELPRIFANAGGSGPAPDAETALKGIDVIQYGREWVPINQAKEQYRNGIITNTQNWKNGELAGGAEPWIDRAVPYNFCTDDRANYTLGCDVFDWGSNHREIVNHQFNSYRLFQPFRRYNRGRIYRLYENVSYYAQWVYGILKSVERPFRYYSYYQWYDLGAYTDDLREASIDAMNFYAELMATPQPGRYCKFGADTAVNSYWWYDLEDTYVPANWDRNDGNCANYIDVDKGHGQFYNYEFTDEYDYRIERVGSYVDKTYATLAMFEISSNYIDSSFFTDFRATNVSYWTLFQDEMLGFLRGTLMGDYDGFAGVYNKQTGAYERPRLIDAKTFGLGVDSDQVNMDRIYTPVSFGHEINLLIGAMIYNHTWQDRNTDFGQYIKLAVTNDESQPFPEATEIHEFVHPVTNQVYQAPQTADGNSISVELVQWATTLGQRYEEAKATRDATTPGTEDYRSANDLLEGRSQQLEDVVAKMDAVRYVYGALGANALR